jgi:DNA-binding NtrC family response regulator
MRRRFSLAPDAMECLKFTIRQRAWCATFCSLPRLGTSDEISASVIEDVISQLAKTGAAKPAAGRRRRMRACRNRTRQTMGNGGTSLVDVEARHIRELLDRYAGNRRLVAEDLGISERTLYRKLKKYDLV